MVLLLVASLFIIRVSIIAREDDPVVIHAAQRSSMDLPDRTEGSLIK